MNDDDRIAAYLDGALPPSEAADFEREVSQDPVLALQLERWRANDAALRAALPPAMPADMEARLAEIIRAAPPAATHGEPTSPAATVVAINAARDRSATRPQPPVQRRWWIAGGALAASLAAVLLFSPGSRNTGDELAAQPGFQLAMNDRLSGDRLAIDDDAQLELLLTVPLRDGGLCREFQLDGPAPSRGLACRRGDQWSVEVLIPGATNRRASDEIAVAGGEGAQAIDSYLTRHGAGDPLDPVAERALFAQQGETGRR